MNRLGGLRVLSTGLFWRATGSITPQAKSSTPSGTAPTRPKILYVNHREKSCGVYQFGKNIAERIAASRKFEIIYIECADERELHDAVRREAPSCIIYNYHESTLAWAKWHAYSVAVPQLAVIHEVYQQAADEASDAAFDYFIAADPTLLLKNPLVFKTGRLVPSRRNQSEMPVPSVPTIGSFGFGTPGKGFENVIEQVQKEFDEAVVRFNIPFAKFGDADGSRARKIAADCHALVRKPGIKVEITHEFMDEQALLDFLAQNTINVFMYEQADARGISSVVDYALAVDRPIAVSDSSMFRHIHAAAPSAIVPKNSLKEIIARGIAPLQKLKSEYSEENLVWDYERIIGEALRRGRRGTTTKKLVNLGLQQTVLKNRKPRLTGWASHDAGRDSRIVELVPESSFVDLPNSVVTGYNRILDNAARETYKPIIEQMMRIVPVMMAKKIPEANIQQAFVLDTAVKFAKTYQAPKILAVGSYEDTAVAVLKALGHKVTDVDPVLNYDLNTYLTKPHAANERFDVVVSTSVIEHVFDDVRFCQDIASVLKPGGVAILTCDYKDDYKPGDDIPGSDYRFYTQRDIRERLVPAIPDCRLYDEPNWDCPNPDFVLIGRYTYTFATIVFQKHS
jgi:SAM-dependent methyltransferase